MPTSNFPRLHWVWAFAASFALAQPAWALFGTAELNKQMAEVNKQMQSLQQRVDALDARFDKLETAMQKNPQLLGLLSEVEMLKAELAKMRGQAEVQTHQLDTLGKRQSDLYADLDQRVADLARAAQPAPVAAPAAAGAPPQTDPLLETRSYEAALSLFRNADYAGAIAGFTEFIKAYPESALASNAQYWIGYSYFALKDYKSALAQQQKLVAVYPASPKVPDALLNIATSQVALKKIADARKTLQEIVAKHPGTNAASLAARRLSALK
jgi:tol-pal system protein YbgF